MVLYAKQDATYVLKFVGDIRYTLGCSLDDFLNRLFQRQDFNSILIDLTETRSIDSTNLGLLAKIANFMRDHFGKKVPLFSTNEDINQVLDSVGFQQVFTLFKDREPSAEATQPVPVSDPSEAEMAQTLYESHRCLCEINERNREMFKSVVEALKGEL